MYIATITDYDTVHYNLHNADNNTLCFRETKVNSAQQNTSIQQGSLPTMIMSSQSNNYNSHSTITPSQQKFTGLQQMLLKREYTAKT